MAEIAQKINNRKYGIDLLIIGLSWLLTYGFMGIFYVVLKIDVGSLPILAQTFIGAIFEFMAMGLGITIVCALRKENFASFGLKKDRLLLTILLSALVCLPDLLLTIFQHGSVTYFPMQGPAFTKPILASGFPVNTIGYLLIITSWGFFEGFTYVVMSDRINKLLPPKNIILNWGAIICGIYCILLHLVVGLTYGGQTFGFETLTTFILMYGMLVVYRYTGNAWGCVFIYLFYWNAIGIS